LAGILALELQDSVETKALRRVVGEAHPYTTTHTGPASKLVGGRKQLPTTTPV